VLVVDRDLDTAGLISDSLSRRGFDAIALGSAPECLEWLERKRADAVIAEVDMPYMSGLQLTAGLRQAYPAMPVVLIAWQVTQQVESDAHALGAFDLLRKPVRVDTVAETVRRALEARI
jgi:DNA-binding NtrC family response regulator